MTRYILVSETNMYTCNICSNNYKNSRSLASHRYTQHRNVKDSFHDGINVLEEDTGDQKIVPTIDRKKREGDLHSEYSEPHAKDSVDEDEVDWSDEEAESDASSHALEGESEDELLFTNLDDDSTSIKRRGSLLSQPKAKRSRKDYESTLELNCKEKPESINLENAENHVKLIKLLCKSVLDGTIQLQPQHVDVLKPHRKFVRKIAQGRIKNVKAIVQKEALRIKQTRRSVLKTVLETVIPIIPSLFV